mgnify:CR=1 FL=1
MLITLKSVNFAEQSLEQFPVAYAVWRISDQVIVYANKHAFKAFGAGPEFIGSTTLWDIIGPLDTNIILSESIRSSPHGGPDLHLPDEAFATFKRLDNGALFTSWYRAKDIIESDGTEIEVVEAEIIEEPVAVAAGDAPPEDDVDA